MKQEKVSVSKSKLDAIAQKIRDKKGETTKYLLDEIPDKIDTLGGSYDGLATLIIGELEV